MTTTLTAMCPKAMMTLMTIDIKQFLKRFLAIAFLMVLSLRASAQFIPVPGEWFHFSYAHLTLLDAPEALEQNIKSQGWQMMLMYESPLGKRSHFGLGYGIGFTGNYWHTNLRMTTNPGGGNMNYSYLSPDSSYAKNRFSSSYIDVPIELRYRSKSNNKGRYFRFYVGGLAGYRIGSFSQFKEGSYNVKHKGLQDLSKWHYGVFVRTGYWLFNLYVYYGMNSVFDPNRSEFYPDGLDKMRSLSVGLSISI